MRTKKFVTTLLVVVASYVGGLTLITFAQGAYVRHQENAASSIEASYVDDEYSGARVTAISINESANELNPAMYGTFETQLFNAMPVDQNYMISPFSLRMALAMAASGASDVTREEILTALGIVDLGEFNQAAMDFIATSNANELVEINIANSIWFNHDFFGMDELDFSDEFRDIIVNYFAGVAPRINNTNGADIVNNWISYQTRDRINDVVTHDVVADSLALLVNAIYFKGDWATPFDKFDTMPDIFTDRDGIETSIDFMNKTRLFDFFENNYFQMLAKPYVDRNIRMYFVLPRTSERLPFNAFEDAIDYMNSTLVEFRVPHFRTESMHDNLVQIMQSMGMQRAFCDSTAEFFDMFTELPTSWPAYISDILQKTFIQIDEEGTEAAAVTVVSLRPQSLITHYPPPIQFFCDRPFIYFIRNDDTGDILFMGEFAFVE